MLLHLKKTWWLMLLFPWYVYAGNEHEPVSARALGMGKCSMLLPDCWAIINNIGALKSDSSRLVAGICSATNWSAALPGVSAVSVVKRLPNNINGGVAVMRSGTELYNETRIVAGVSHKIGWMQIGVSATYLRNQVKDLVSKGAIIIETGGVAEFGNTRIGMHLYNITGSYMGTDKYKAIIPPGLRVGTSYSILGKALMSAEFSKSINIPVNIRLGVEYNIDSLFSVRTGVESNTQILTMGAGIHTRNGNFYISGQSLANFGYAIAVSAEIRLGKSHSTINIPTENKVQ